MTATELRIIPLSQIETPNYQRDIRTRHVERMVRNWNSQLAGTPLVSRRDNNRYFVVDGQHRIEAMRQLFDESYEVQCLVVTGLTEQEEAENFWKTQESAARKSLHPFDVHRAAIVSGDEAAIAIDSIVRECGFRIGIPGGRHGTRPKGYVQAVGVLQGVYKELGPETLRRTLSVIHAMWDGETPTGSLIAGLARFLRMFPDMKAKRLDDAISRYSIDQLEAKAKAAAATLGYRPKDGMAFVIWTEYNKNLRTSNLPSFEEAKDTFTRGAKGRQA